MTIIEAGIINNDLSSFLNLLTSSSLKGIMQLNLWNNHIGDKGAKQIADFLKSQNLPDNFALDLGDNDITFDGLAYFIEAIKSGYCPKNLWIGFWNNYLGDEGASMLAEMLKHPNCPENLKLHLGQNQIGKIGVEEFGKALKHPNCVKHLHLNLYPNDGLKEDLFFLADGLKRNLTAKIKISLNDDDYKGSYESKLINFYNFRNKLIQSNPDYENFIKTICFKNNLYTPILKHEPMSLKEYSGLFVLKQKISPEVYKQKLPQELTEFFEILKFLTDKIETNKKFISPIL